MFAREQVGESSTFGAVGKPLVVGSIACLLSTWDFVHPAKARHPALAI